MSEQTIHDDSNILITNKRISIHGTTYPIKQITSVSISSTKKDPTVPTSEDSGLPGVLFFSALAGLIVGSSTSEILGWIVFIVLVGGFIAYSVSIKPVFHLKLGIASKEIEILNSSNHEYIQSIHDKINDAVFNLN